MNRMLKWFPAEDNPLSQAIRKLAFLIDSSLPECAEKTAGLRKLVETKDCVVRASIEAKEINHRV